MQLDEILYYLARIALNVYFFYAFGTIKGILLAFGFHYVFMSVMYYIFGLTALGAMDEVFLHDDDNNPCNVMGCLMFEHYDFESFKNQIRDKGFLQPRVPSVVVKVFGKYYWKRLSTPVSEIEKQVFFKIDNVNSDEQLAEFMANEVTKVLPKDYVLHRNFFFHKFNGKESCYVFKIQHCLADGLSCVQFMNSFQDDNYTCQLPRIKGFTRLQKLMMLALSPLSILQSILYVKNLENDDNFIHHGQKLAGVKRAAFVGDISMRAVKAKCKELQITVNDFVMALLAVSIKEYLVLNGDSKAQKINMAVPFGLRDPDLGKKDFQLVNDFVPITVELDLCPTFEESLNKVRARMNQLKKSLIPSGQYYFMKLASYMPSNFFKYLAQGVGERHTMIFSNVPGPSSPFQVAGKKSTRGVYIAAGVGQLSTGITVSTVFEWMKMGITSDIANIPDPRVLAKIIDANAAKVLSNVKAE